MSGRLGRWLAVCKLQMWQQLDEDMKETEEGDGGWLQWRINNGGVNSSGKMQFNQKMSWLREKGQICSTKPMDGEFKMRLM